jgi:hypothetical protein
MQAIKITRIFQNTTKSRRILIPSIISAIAERVELIVNVKNALIPVVNVIVSIIPAKKNIFS